MKMKTLSAGAPGPSFLCRAPRRPGQGKLVGLPGGARTWLEEEVVYIITAQGAGRLPQARPPTRSATSSSTPSGNSATPLPGTPKNEFRGGALPPDRACQQDA